MEKVNLQIDSLIENSSQRPEVILYEDITNKENDIKESLLFTGVIDFREDTVMVLNKEQATNVANQILSHIDLRNRFVLSLQRHEALIDLYDNSLKQLETKKSIIENKDTSLNTKNKQIEILTSENKRLRSQAKKIKTKALINGLGIGIVIGAVGTTLVFLAAN